MTGGLSLYLPGPTAFFLPLKGVSILDSPGKEFWWPEADRALYDAIKKHVRPDIQVYELDNNINDNEFAEAVRELRKNLSAHMDYLVIDAQLKRKKFDSLTKEGFSEVQALELCKGPVMG